MTTKTDQVAQTSEFPFRRANPLNPPPAYADFRNTGRLKKVQLWNGKNAWLITKYDDVKSIISSPNVSANPFTPGYPFMSPRREASIKSYLTFLVMDPPDHTKFRMMLTGDFRQKRMQELRPKMEKMVDDLIDNMLAKKAPVDFVDVFSQKLPVNVISALLGVPHEIDDQLIQWVTEQLGLTGDPAVVIKANQDMLAYFDQLIAKMEKGPIDENQDMLSKLVANVQSGSIERMDAVRLAWQLYFAGADTTANMIALGTLSLMLDSEQRNKLVANPSLVENAVEEMLRYHAVAHFNVGRAATADLKVGDEVIPKGDGLYALNNAAGRDPTVFPEPDKFDIERKNASDHVTFGYGIHQCLGQTLARLELRCVFAKLFQRVPGLKLAVPFEQLRFKEDMHVYGLHSMPVTW